MGAPDRQNYFPTNTPDEKIGFFPRQFQLLLCFQADHGLMEEHMVKHAAQGIVRVGISGGIFHRFRDGDPEASLAMRVLGQNLLSTLRQFRG